MKSPLLWAFFIILLLITLWLFKVWFSTNLIIHLFLRLNNYPQFSLTPEQNNYFNNNLNYSQNPIDVQHTILGRILTGDSSAQNITPQQQDVANQVHLDMQKRLNKYFGI